MTDDQPPVALTIAGSDSGGGAGIQADLATFAALGVHGTSVITAVTAQNTATVEAVEATSAELVATQLDAVLADLPVAAVKTGMLANAGVMNVVARWASEGRLPNLVVDPVLVSSSGDRLFAAEADQRYLTGLFPHARIVTPNAREAALLLGQPVEAIATVEDQRHAARALSASTAGWVVVKGGHLHGGEAIDVVVESSTGETTELTSPWIETANDHGTGCTFAAATTARLAAGAAPLDALRDAKAFVHRGLERSRTWKLGAGHGPVAHTFER